MHHIDVKNEFSLLGMIIICHSVFFSRSAVGLSGFGRTGVTKRSKCHCIECGMIIEQENEAKAKAQEDEQQQAEQRFLELQRKAKEQQDKSVSPSSCQGQLF